jgi:hypothetical protein
MDRLHLLVFLLKPPLHLEVGLSLFLDPLLLHVSNDSGVHCLELVSCDSKVLRVPWHTAFSAVCAQCTNATMPMVPTIVPTRVVLEAADMLKMEATICPHLEVFNVQERLMVLAKDVCMIGSGEPFPIRLHSFDFHSSVPSYPT